MTDDMGATRQKVSMVQKVDDPRGLKVSFPPSLKISFIDLMLDCGGRSKWHLITRKQNYVSQRQHWQQDVLSSFNCLEEKTASLRSS